MSTLCIPGINIQLPWSRLIVEGKKKIETRTYPLPEKFKGKPLAIIQTSGKKTMGNKLSTSIIGIVIFSNSKKYKNKKNWKSESSLHLVQDLDPNYGWDDKKEKWGWEIYLVIPFNELVAPPLKRGIVYTSSCKIPAVYLAGI